MNAPLSLRGESGASSFLHPDSFCIQFQQRVTAVSAEEGPLAPQASATAPEDMAMKEGADGFESANGTDRLEACRVFHRFRAPLFYSPPMAVVVRSAAVTLTPQIALYPQIALAPVIALYPQIAFASGGSEGVPKPQIAFTPDTAL